MQEYHKIQTVYKRDPATKHKTLLEGEFSLPIFDYLKDNQWVWTEKIDGTNIRVTYMPDAGDTPAGDPRVIFGGKTDNAQIPAKLVNKLQELFPAEKFKDFDGPVTLYGEGFGASIQKGGGNYVPDGVDFILFDVKIGPWWLEHKDVVDIAGKFGIKVVPIVGRGTLLKAVERARPGFNSTFGPFQAEGLVMRPAVGMNDRSGKRVIAKIKCKDFLHE